MTHDIPGFLADHDLDARIINGILRREPAVRFPRVQQLGMADRPDGELLEAADQLGLIMVSHDVNTMTAAAFHRLGSGQGHPGLILVPHRLSLRVAIDELLMIWSASDLAEWRDRVVFLPL